METAIIQIGNSKGLRLSKTILEKYHIKDKVELILEKDQTAPMQFRFFTEKMKTENATPTFWEYQKNLMALPIMQNGYLDRLSGKMQNLKSGTERM